MQVKRKNCITFLLYISIRSIPRTFLCTLLLRHRLQQYIFCNFAVASKLQLDITNH